MNASSHDTPPTFEWVLPDVLPGVCRLFMHVKAHSLGERPASTSWQPFTLDESGLTLYRVCMPLTSRMTQAQLEAIFPEEPTLDQLDALLELAHRLERGGMPALVSGRY